MRMLDAATDTLLLIDLQPRLLPVIEGNAEVIANAKRLRDAALMLEVPLVFTEQNPKGLGPTVPELASNAAPVVRKMTFSAAAAPDFPAKSETRPRMVVVGCEAHICVLQTVLDLIDEGRDIAVVRDAIGSRRTESRDAAITRMERHGVEIVTTEMVVFEWLKTFEHPNFRAATTLVK